MAEAWQKLSVALCLDNQSMLEIAKITPCSTMRKLACRWWRGRTLPLDNQLRLEKQKSRPAQQCASLRVGGGVAEPWQKLSCAPCLDNQLRLEIAKITPAKRCPTLRVGGGVAEAWQKLSVTPCLDNQSMPEIAKVTPCSTMRKLACRWWRGRSLAKTFSRIVLR